MKISSIGQYIRSVLIRNVRDESHAFDAQFFGWEISPEIEQQRSRRKIIQFAVNQALFVGSGLVAMMVFFIITTPLSVTWWLAGIDILLLAVLAIEIGRYADIQRR